MQLHPTAPRGPMMARPAGLPCPDCEGLLSRVTTTAGVLAHTCGTSLGVRETREDPEHPVAACVWRLRHCPEDGAELATVQFVTSFGGDPLPAGARVHECLDCGTTFTSLERQVSDDEARDRLAHLARERTMLARAGRSSADPWARTRELPPTIAWHLEGR